MEFPLQTLFVFLSAYGSLINDASGASYIFIKRQGGVGGGFQFLDISPVVYFVNIWPLKL